MKTSLFVNKKMAIRCSESVRINKCFHSSAKKSSASYLPIPRHGWDSETWKGTRNPSQRRKLHERQRRNAFIVQQLTLSTLLVLVSEKNVLPSLVEHPSDARIRHDLQAACTPSAVKSQEALLLDHLR